MSSHDSAHEVATAKRQSRNPDRDHDESGCDRERDAREARGSQPGAGAPRRLEPTPDALSLIAAAEQMEAVQLTFERELLARRPQLASGLTITAAEWGIPLLTPILGELARRHPELPLRLHIENRAVDLARREADLAIRVGKPRDEALAGRRLGVVRYGLYGGARYLERHPPPRKRGDVARHAYCALDERLAHTPHMRWQAALAGAAPVVLRTSSMLALVEAARSGLGLATLPCMLADRHPELVRVLPELDVVERDLWLVFHRDLRRSRSLRPLVDDLAEAARPLFTASPARSPEEPPSADRTAPAAVGSSGPGASARLLFRVARSLSNVVGFDDSPFGLNYRGLVRVVGAVCARTRLEGVLSTMVERDGDDATDRLIELVRASRFGDHIRAVLLQGIALAGFNIVDVERLAGALRIPVLVVVRKLPRLHMVKDALLARTPGGAHKWELIEKQGPLEKLGPLWVQRVGLTTPEAAELLAVTTSHGNIPEPLRLAHIIAGGVERGESRGRP